MNNSQARKCLECADEHETKADGCKTIRKGCIIALFHKKSQIMSVGMPHPDRIPEANF